VSLAEIYVRLGRKAEAERERAEAQRLAMTPQEQP